MPRKVDVVRTGIAAYNRRDFDVLQATYHPDVELDWSESRGLEARVFRGREAVMQFHLDFVETFEEVRLEAERVIESDDLVIVPNSAQMRGRGGIETVARSTLVFEFRGGRVARLSLYQSTGEALEAIGLQLEEIGASPIQ